MQREQETDDAMDILEDGVGKFFVGTYRLRQAGRVQEEYDSMGAMINMLNEARQHLRKNFDIEI